MNFVKIFVAAAVGSVVLTSSCANAVSPVPRRVRVDGQRFLEVATNSSIVLAGPNVVVKGPPYLPAVSGTTHCHDVNNATCAAA